MLEVSSLDSWNLFFWGNTEEKTLPSLMEKVVMQNLNLQSSIRGNQSVGSKGTSKPLLDGHQVLHLCTLDWGLGSSGNSVFAYKIIPSS